jgi:hypothetical protein
LRALLQLGADDWRFQLRSRNLWELGLEFHNVLGLVPLRPLGNVEFYVIAFVQGFETAGLNCGMVHENIIPGIAPDKSIAFFIVKPFYDALFFHFSSSLHFKILRGTQECNYWYCLFLFHSFPWGIMKPNGGSRSTFDSQDPSP